MALEADYIDASLNTFLKALITAYSRIPYTMDTPVSCLLYLSIYEVLTTFKFLVRLRLLRPRQLV